MTHTFRPRGEMLACHVVELLFSPPSYFTWILQKRQPLFFIVSFLLFLLWISLLISKVAINCYSFISQIMYISCSILLGPHKAAAVNTKETWGTADYNNSAIPLSNIPFDRARSLPGGVSSTSHAHLEATLYSLPPLISLMDPVLPTYLFLSFLHQPSFFCLPTIVDKMRELKGHPLRNTNACSLN